MSKSASELPPPPPFLVSIELTPKPGFCIKTSTLGGSLPSSIHIQPRPQSPTPIPTAIPEGLKVFVNIGWDHKVPPSPKGSEEAVLRALQGEDVDEVDAAGLYIPAIVSSAREDKDKAGNPSLVFDCIYNTTIKARMQQNLDFKEFLIESSLQRIEAQAGLILSREIRTPNISSKGKLGPRTAEVPGTLLLETPLGQPPPDTAPQSTGHPETSHLVHTTQPSLAWSWTKDDQRHLIRIAIEIPHLTESHIANATLDIGPRKLLLAIPDYQPLDIDLELSDAEISSLSRALRHLPASDETDERNIEEETMRILRLKRERDFDVEAAEAEWRIGSGTVLVYV